MSNYLEQWIEHLKESDKSKNTIDSYQRDVFQFIQFLSYINKSIIEVKKEDINEFKNSLSDNKISISSINRKLVSINNYIQYLNNELEMNIIVKIKSEKVQKKNYLEEQLNQHDFNKIITVAERKGDYRFIAMINTLYYTGMRISEMLQLTVNDIDKDYVTILGKGNKNREIFISDKLKVILKDYVLNHRLNKDTNILFTSKKGIITRTTFNSEIKEYGTVAKVSKSKCHAHSLRHLYCLLLIEKGISIDTVADLAGHSDINTTRIYTRKTKNQLRNTINDIL